MYPWRSLLFYISCMAASLVLSAGHSQHQNSPVGFYRLAEDQLRQLRSPFQGYERDEQDFVEFEESRLQDYHAVDPRPRLSSPLRPGPIENFRRPPVNSQRPNTPPPQQSEMPPTNLPHESASTPAPS
ncbi:hypothetical protein O6H91_06G134400 [Diphasiastrum complanatum]|uniref:Uncharacterized protein n=2 Tax=Diphasiastrum complanatum TaxID=34168 RepID=A0ACC2DJF7_DIPCM|nr:hypothetical protein O6H91_06G134300 [Diphasiastrum complanatum]KAJ7554305.1 hypothetical protein O6H91_06G134400 [Diphasiastrum complanatum]